MRRLLLILLLLVPSPCLAQGGTSTECTPEGVWYGGSVVAYQMTITAARSGGHYSVVFEGMYKNSVLNTAIAGHLVRRAHAYQGSLMQLSTSDPDFLNPPPIGKMPDLFVGWTSIEMLDCNTIRNTIPFFGIYLASNIWSPGILWNPAGKTPLFDAPDVDLLNVLTGGVPIVETYRRLPNTVNPLLLHND